MNRKRAVSILAIIMAVVMILSLILSVLPRAYAVTQSEIDAVRAKKDELTALVKEAEDRLTKMQDRPREDGRPGRGEQGVSGSARAGGRGARHV